MDSIDTIKRKGAALGACGLIEGIRSLHDAMDLLFSAQGREFLKKSGFPDLRLMRRLRSRVPSAPDTAVAVDKGRTDIGSHNALVAGKTSATLRASSPERLYRIIVAHGASLHIELSDYAVATVTNAGGTITIKNDGTAKITIE